MNDPNTNPTQAQRILDKLREHANQWVAMPLLAEISGAYAVHSRIAELRNRLGHHIEHRNEPIKGSRTKRSFYRLVELEEATV